MDSVAGFGPVGRGSNPRRPVHYPFIELLYFKNMIQDERITTLAYKRTELARDRTALAMIRTSLALILAGVAFIGFSDGNLWFYPSGIIAISLGLIFLIVTGRHFFKHSRELKNLMGKSL